MEKAAETDSGPEEHMMHQMAPSVLQTRRDNPGSSKRIIMVLHCYQLHQYYRCDPVVK